MSVTADALRTHLDYTAWASMLLLDAAAKLTPEELTRDFGTADRSVVGTLAHIFAGDRIWFTRVMGRPHHPFISDADRDLGLLKERWPALLAGWKTWASELTDDRAISPITYKDHTGREWTMTLWQLVFHAVNHGTHHRGQVSGFLRSLGHTPPPTDLLFYYRRSNPAP
jgi:uncharacterized damage-inducible protein DinB